MLKLLIADGSNDLAAALSRRLQGRYKIYTCHDSNAARRLANTVHPDILVINLSLYPNGAFSVLRDLPVTPSVIVALTTLVSDDVLQTAANLGIKDVIRIPCTIQHIISHIELLTDKKAPSQGC